MLKICFYGSFFISPIIKELEKKGHSILYNQFSKDADIILTESHSRMYEIYPILSKIKHHKIKLVNFLLDIPPWRLSLEDSQNKILKLIFQYFYHLIHRNAFLDRILSIFLKLLKKYKNTRKIVQIINYILNTHRINKTFYLVNYKRFLKKADLNLSISGFTQFCFKKLLNVDSKVCYPGVNSELINSLPKNLETIYDAINISRIVPHKHQIMLEKAAKKLNLKIAIIGPHQDKTIKLDCPHFALSHVAALKSLIQSKIYVDPSLFEGFGLTPVEAAFLEKITIASDTFVHKEVLGNYPLYFKKNDLDDLINKITYALNGEFQLNREAVDWIKIKYSLESSISIQSLAF